jgi:hypothetical protein
LFANFCFLPLFLLKGVSKVETCLTEAKPHPPPLEKKKNPAKHHRAIYRNTSIRHLRSSVYEVKEATLPKWQQEVGNLSQGRVFRNLSKKKVSIQQF